MRKEPRKKYQTTSSPSSEKKTRENKKIGVKEYKERKKERKKEKKRKAMIRERTKHVVTHTRLVRIWLVETLVSKSLCLVSVMLQRLPAVLSRIGIILASPLVRPPIALGRGHDFARILFFSLHQISLSLSIYLSLPLPRFDSIPRNLAFRK